MRRFLLTIAAIQAIAVGPRTACAGHPAAYDLVWDSPSADARGSMPLGNGDLGLNVWVEPTGDLVLLLGKTDSFDEFNRLLKLGRIRLRTTPALVQPGKPFTQALRLAEGLIEIDSPTARLRIWVDANNPAIQIEGLSQNPLQVQTTLETWRTEARALGNEGPGASSCWGNWPEKFRVNPDTIFPRQGSRLAWCHHNTESQWRRNLELTALAAEADKGADPVQHRTFGGLIEARGLASVSDTELKTPAPVTSFDIRVVVRTAIEATPEAWLAGARKLAASIPSAPDPRFEAHRKWWAEFWDRSWIEIEGGPPPTLSFPGPLRLGSDPSGGNPFRGTLGSPLVKDQVLTAAEIKALAGARPAERPADGPVPDLALDHDFTVAVWIKPAPGESGRIFDKCTPGHPDGLLFDTHPGESLRLSIGQCVINAPKCLQPGRWHHVAATYRARESKQELYLDGVLLESKAPESDTFRLSRAYALQRFITACAGRGPLPIKFNGSLFTVEGHDPDFRAWGGGYWWQNTRLPYWAMLSSGDHEMMQPLFRMYVEALPLRQAATRTYYHHEGAFFPETMYFWGNYMDAENYGLDRKDKEPGLTDNTYIRRYWQGGIELVAMMLDCYDDTEDAGFRDKTLLPTARQIVLFFDQHWKRGPDGKILFDPAQSLETWHKARNPLPEIAGLRFVLPRLMRLPADESSLARWKKLLDDLPAVPMKTENGRTRLAPAEAFSDLRNSENPELYAVFPYRLHTVLAGAQAREIGLNTWQVRRHPEDNGWQQNAIQAALLGSAREAAAMVVGRAQRTAAGYRFPGFFGPNYDWTPDQDHPSVMMSALQRMLMQCEGRRIVLTPAWPKEWNGTFKLHAPLKTTVRGVIKNGLVADLVVTPSERRQDIEILPPQ